MKKTFVLLACVGLTACTEYPAITESDLSVAATLCKDRQGVQSIQATDHAMSRLHEVRATCKDGTKVFTYITSTLIPTNPKVKE